MNNYRTSVAPRPQDLQDVANLLEMNSKIDARRIRKWVKEFADVLEAPDLITDIENLLEPKNH